MKMESKRVKIQKEKESFFIISESGWKIKLWIDYSTREYFVEPIKGQEFRIRGSSTKDKCCYNRQKEIVVLIYTAIEEAERILGIENV